MQLLKESISRERIQNLFYLPKLIIEIHKNISYIKLITVEDKYFIIAINGPNRSYYYIFM